MKHKFVRVIPTFTQVAKEAENLLNGDEGWKIAKYISFERTAIVHLILPEEGDIEAAPIAPLIESVIEIAVTTNPEPIRKLTSDGWVIKNLYSKKAQLVKYREEGGEDAEEND